MGQTPGQASEWQYAAVGQACGRVGHDLLGALAPIRIQLRALARTGTDVEGLSSACLEIQRVGEGMQLLTAGSRISAASDLGAVWSIIEPFVRGALPRSVGVRADLGDPAPRVAASRESVAQGLFRAVCAVGAHAAQKGTLHVRGETEGRTVRIRVWLGGRGEDGLLEQPGWSEGLVQRITAGLDPAITAETEEGAVVICAPLDATYG